MISVEWKTTRYSHKTAFRNARKRIEDMVDLLLWREQNISRITSNWDNGINSIANLIKTRYSGRKSKQKEKLRSLLRPFRKDTTHVDRLIRFKNDVLSCLRNRGANEETCTSFNAFDPTFINLSIDESVKVVSPLLRQFVVSGNLHNFNTLSTIPTITIKQETAMQMIISNLNVKSQTQLEFSFNFLWKLFALGWNTEDLWSLYKCVILTDSERDFTVYFHNTVKKRYTEEIIQPPKVLMLPDEGNALYFKKFSEYFNNEGIISKDSLNDLKTEGGGYSSSILDFMMNDIASKNPSFVAIPSSSFVAQCGYVPRNVLVKDKLPLFHAGWQKAAIFINIESDHNNWIKSRIPISEVHPLGDRHILLAMIDRECKEVVFFECNNDHFNVDHMNALMPKEACAYADIAEYFTQGISKYLSDDTHEQKFEWNFMACEKRYDNLGDCATLAAMYLMMFARSSDVMTDIDFGKVKVYRSCRRKFRMSLVKSIKRAKPRLADAEHFEISEHEYSLLNEVYEPNSSTYLTNTSSNEREYRPILLDESTIKIVSDILIDSGFEINELKLEDLTVSSEQERLAIHLFSESLNCKNYPNSRTQLEAGFHIVCSLHNQRFTRRFIWKFYKQYVLTELEQDFTLRTDQLLKQRYPEEVLKSTPVLLTHIEADRIYFEHFSQYLNNHWKPSKETVEILKQPGEGVEQCILDLTLSKLASKDETFVAINSSCMVAQCGYVPRNTFVECKMPKFDDQCKKAAAFLNIPSDHEGFRKSRLPVTQMHPSGDAHTLLAMIDREDKMILFLECNNDYFIEYFMGCRPPFEERAYYDVAKTFTEGVSAHLFDSTKALNFDFLHCKKRNDELGDCALMAYIYLKRYVESKPSITQTDFIMNESDISIAARHKIRLYMSKIVSDEFNI